MRYILFIFSLLCLTLGVKAQEVSCTKYIGIGYNSLQDTYLSPEHYGGTELRYLSHTLRENGRSPFTGKEGNRDWTRIIVSEGRLNQGSTRARKGAVLAGDYHFEYGIMHRKRLMDNRLTLQGGAMAEGLIGFIYNTRNGNNPAQMRALMNVGAVAHVRYALTKKFNVEYEASLPLLGMTFSPNYGQSYYEIFERGNCDHNIVPTTIGCMPSLRQMLTVSIPVKRLRLSVGYLGDYRQQSVNNLKQHVYSHNIIIGVSKKR